MVSRASVIVRAVREMLRANDQRHILYDPMLAVDLFCQPIERTNMASGAGLGESGLRELSQALRGRGEDRLLVDQVVPHLQKSHLGIAANPPDIGFDHRARSLLGIGPVAAEKERSNRSARGQPLEVPLPWPGKNLVKIVDCENQVALRRREQAEIHQMHVAAGHHLEIGARGACEISRHDCGASLAKRRTAKSAYAPFARARAPLCGWHSASQGPKPDRAVRARAEIPHGK